jgi:hypothetical protein
VVTQESEVAEGTTATEESRVHRHDEVTDEREQEIERLRRLVAEVQPAVAELTGFPEGEPIKVAVMTRQELRKYITWSVETGYPNDELGRRGRCLAMIGLLPEDYDLESGMMALVGEQAAGLYDPYWKAFNGILNLPPALKSSHYQRLIASHELTHAFQDRMVDILVHAELGLANMDYEYGFRSVLEGIATVVMLAYTEDVGVGDIRDARSYMRAAFNRNLGNPGMTATQRTPEYLRELLISPYAEGGAFVEAWYQANPDLMLADLMRNIPASSEQVLHPEKYFDPDEPTMIDLAGLESSVPEGWEVFYTNTLGEFDLLTLFSIHAETSSEAADLAAGWDGLGFIALEDENGQVLMLGSSVWDTERDADEFYAGFYAVLAEVGDPDTFTVAGDGTWVDFVIGPADGSLREGLLTAVAETRHVGK